MAFLYNDIKAWLHLRVVNVDTWIREEPSLHHLGRSLEGSFKEKPNTENYINILLDIIIFSIKTIG